MSGMPGDARFAKRTMGGTVCAIALGLLCVLLLLLLLLLLLPLLLLLLLLLPPLSVVGA